MIYPLDLFKNFIVSDYYIFKSLIFAQITLQKDEYQLYGKCLILCIGKSQNQIYMCICIKIQSACFKISRRGRSYEQNIEASYLQKIHDGYRNFMRTEQLLNTVIIDVSELDFISLDDYKAIIKS